MSNLIDALVDDLRPVRPISPRMAIAIVASITAVLAVLVAMTMGLRADILAGNPQAILLMRAGVLLLLGTATMAALVSAARPGVGQQSDGWRWALGAAAIFPVSAIVLVIAQGALPMGILTANSAPYCLAVTLTGALAMGAPLTAWLRRGAVTQPERVGWLVGFASGAFALFAYNLHCPSQTLVYTGIWYTSAVGLAAIVGRLTVPRLLRW